MNGKARKKRDKEIVQRVTAGETPAAIADDYQLSRQAIYVILRRNGHQLAREWVSVGSDK